MKTGLVAALMAMLVLPTLIMAVGGYLLTQKAVSGESAATSGELLLWKTKQLALEFDDLSNTLRELGTQSPLASSGLVGAEVIRSINGFAAEYRRNFDSFIVYDSPGTIVFPEKMAGPTEQDSLIGPVWAESKTIMVCHTVYACTVKDHVFWLYTPIGTTDHAKSGVLAGRVNTAWIARISSEISAADSSTYFLIDGRNRTIVPLAELSKHLTHTTGLPCNVESAFAGETGVKQCQDSTGRKIISACASIGMLNWFVLAERDIDTHPAGLRGLRWKTIGLFGGLSAICIICALFMSHQIVYRLERREQQTAQQSRQLIAADKLATVGTMAASVAHEINNPLTTINILIHNLFEKSPADDPQRMDLNIALDEITKIKNIVLRFWEFARPQEPEFSEVQVNTVVHRFCQLIRHQTAAKEINIVEHLDDRVPPVVADPSQIDQAILNILFNAIEATPEKGTIELSTAFTPERSVLVRVFNTGPELAPELAEKIFEPFFSTKAQGTGLGLSIARMIMERHGGRVTAAAVPGRGTEFVLTLYIDKWGMGRG